MCNSKKIDLTLSPLPKTWIIDIDGTILEHNGYLKNGDVIIPKSLEFLNRIPQGDEIILLTARNGDLLESTEVFLRDNGVPFTRIIGGASVGERILVNDSKPSGLKTAYAVNVVRDRGINIDLTIDSNL